MILVFDYTDAASLTEAHEWYNRMRDQINPDQVVMCLVANKADDIERQEVTRKDLQTNAERIGAHISMELSAKTGLNVEKLFNEIAV